MTTEDPKPDKLSKRIYKYLHLEQTIGGSPLNVQASRCICVDAGQHAEISANIAFVIADVWHVIDHADSLAIRR